MVTKYTRKKKVDNIDLDVNHDVVLDSTRGFLGWLEARFPLVIAGVVAALLVWGGVVFLAKKRAAAQIEATNSMSDSLKSFYDESTGVPKAIEAGSDSIKSSEAQLSKLIESGISGGMSSIVSGARGALRFYQGNTEGSTKDYASALGDAGGKSIAFRGVLTDGLFANYLSQKKWEEAEALLPDLARSAYPTRASDSVNIAAFSDIKRAEIRRKQGDFPGAKSLLVAVIDRSGDPASNLAATAPANGEGGKTRDQTRAVIDPMLIAKAKQMLTRVQVGQLRRDLPARPKATSAAAVSDTPASSAENTVSNE